MTAAEYQGNRFLPIGVVAEKPPATQQVGEAEQFYKITDSTFYVDMQGENGTVSKVMGKNSIAEIGKNAFVISLIILFILIRVITVKTGIFSPVFPKKDKKKENK